MVGPHWIGIEDMIEHFLITPPGKRRITKTFIAPNRIIAGERQHRLEVLYHIFKNKLINNHISCPDVCPAEDISIYEAIKPLAAKYPDIDNCVCQCVIAHAL
jgi:hypothetical protein